MRRRLSTVDFASCTGYASLERRLWDCVGDPASMARLRRMLRPAGVGVELSRLSDHEVIDQVARMIVRGRLRTGGGSHGGASKGGGQGSAEDRLVFALHADGQDFAFEGQHLRLIPANRWATFRGADRYQPLASQEALRLLERMAGGSGLSDRVRSFLGEARGLILGSSPGRSSGGLLLVRRISVSVHVAAAREAPVTPSQLRKLVEAANHWVEFLVVDRLGKPVGSIPYAFHPPSGKEERAKLANSGRIRRDGCEEGNYLLELGELTSSAWLVDGVPVTGPVPAARDLTLVVQTTHLFQGMVGKFEVFHLCQEDPGTGITTATASIDAEEQLKTTFKYTPEKGVARQSELIFSCTVGKLWIKSPPIVVVHPRLFRPLWSSHEAYVGDELGLAVECPGVPDGESVEFKVQRLDTDGVVATLTGTTQGEAASVRWKSVDPDPETPESELYFVASWQDLKTRSRALLLKDRVEYLFQDPDGKPLPDLPVVLVYGDGTRRAMRTDCNGMLRLTDPRAMTARVSVAGCEDGDVSLVKEESL